MKHTIFFSLFGKKMQWTTEANSPQDAEYKLRGKIIIEKVTVAEEDKAQSDFDSLNDIIFGNFKNQKQGK